jgi:hypothetical protein
VVLGDTNGFERALTALGVHRFEPREADGGRPDLIFTTESNLVDAIRHGAPAVIAEGGGGQAMLTSAGYEVQRFLPLPDAARPQILVPLSNRGPLHYAIRRGAPAPPWKRLRNRLAFASLSRGLPLPGKSLISVALLDPGPPFLVGEAERFGVPRGAEWILYPAGGDVLSRGTFHLFRPGEASPSWVLKFTGVPGYSEVFDADQRGLTIAESSGEVVAAHAPRLLGRFGFDDLHASLETAAVGPSLAAYLGSSASRSDKLRVVERIAEWLLELSLSTAAAPERLTGERERIRTEVLPHWRSAPRSLVDDLPPVPGVVQHNDLGTWNIIVEPPFSDAGFVAIDWEGAERVGMPLWDLWYFLQHALAQLDGISGGSEEDLARRERHAVGLFLGELPSSELLFEWTRRFVSALELPDSAVGPLATLCILQHGLSQSARERSVRHQGAGDRTIETIEPRVAERWLSDPGLGPGWDRWR